MVYHRLPESNKIAKKLISKYPKLINLNKKDTPDYEKIRREKLCKQWSEKIEPEPGKFIKDLFRFFMENKEELILCNNYKENYEKTIQIAKNVLKDNNPLEYSKVIKESKTKAKVWQIFYYNTAIKLIYKEKVNLDEETRDNVFRYLPFNINDDYETTLKVAKTPSAKAIQDIIDVYAGKRDDDLGIYHIRQFLELYNKMKMTQFEPILLKMLKEDAIEEYEKIYIIQSLPANVLTAKIIKENMKKLDKNSSLYGKYLSALMLKHNDKEAIEEAFNWTLNKAKSMENIEIFGNPLSEIRNNIPLAMTKTGYSVEKDKELLLLSSQLSKNGQKKGSNFLMYVVDYHLAHLIETDKKAFETILNIEKFLEVNKDEKDLHWFEYTLKDLKKSYLNKIKEPDMIGAIKKYNEMINKDYLPISSSVELVELIKDILEEDIKQWIEDEGAYKHIQELSKKENSTNAEDFISKSIKSQIELSLLKRGIRNTDIAREEQLIDDKRLDFVLRYGFVGKVMIELKLANNNEAKASTGEGKKYKNKLKKYMMGTKSDYGLFVIFNIKENNTVKFNKQIEDLNKMYEDVENVSIVKFDCIN